MTLSQFVHPFTPDQWQDVQRLLCRLTREQALWLSGFLAGQGQIATPKLPAQDAQCRILVAFGSETGNSKALAHQLAELVRERGISLEVSDLAGMRPRQLAKFDHLLLICSTHGDGDPPEPIHAFYDALMDAAAPQLPKLRYSVLALGDSSYEQFCLTGRRIDERLAELGAQRLAPRQDCDVDFAEPARRWIEQVLEALPRAAVAAAEVAAPGANPAPAAREYDKNHPLRVEVLENIRLSGPHRETPNHHLVLALDAPDFHLEPGDAIGVLADNPPALVAAILRGTGLSGEEPVMQDGQAVPLVQALRERCDLTIPSQRFLEFWAGASQSAELARQLQADPLAQRAFLRGHQVRDLIASHPARVEAQALVDNLRPLQPRLYDLANSIARQEDELHLCVQLYRYEFGGREEAGIASDYLVQLQPGDQVRIYPHRNARFHLPEDQKVPLILIAEGTGIAPYRAFLQEMERAGRRHPCWIIFAEQRFEEDFLYQTEWQQALRQGRITRFDTIFYLDQPGRTLADPLRENLDQAAQWLNSGGHLYFCGDKERLGQCEKELRALLEGPSGVGPVWKQLNGDKRIHRNLY